MYLALFWLLPLIRIPASFSIDLSGLVDYASTIFNALAGAFVPIWGIMLGLGILGMVTAVIVGAIKGRGR